MRGVALTFARQRADHSLGRGLFVALVLSVAGAALFAASMPMLAAGTAMRLLVALLGGAWLLYLMAGSAQRIGSFVTLVIWSVTAVVLWLASPPFSVYVLTHVAMLWLARSLLRYTGVLPVLADFALCLFALAFAYWAAIRTGSAFLALWCFFLVQALYVFIPQRMRGPARGAPRDETDQAFRRAQRSAESALRRLAAQR
jgi:hypothetical protein